MFYSENFTSLEKNYVETSTSDSGRTDNYSGSQFPIFLLVKKSLGS